METHMQYEILYNTLEDGVCIVDADERITMWNRAAEKITGYKAEEVLGSCHPDNILHHIDLQGRPLEFFNSPISPALCDAKHHIDEVMIRHKSGYRIAVLSKIMPVYGDGHAVTGTAEIFTPRTRIDDDRFVDAPSRIVTTDALTGLPNRASLENNLDYRINAHRGTGALFCVLCLNIDHLGVVNSAYGYHVGDMVLHAIAAELKNNLRKTDAIGRWDSKTFLGLFTIPGNHAACLLAERVRALVAGCAIWDEDRRINVTGSVGVAIIRWTDSADSIVDRAHRFMLQSQKRGKNHVSVEDVENENVVAVNA